MDNHILAAMFYGFVMQTYALLNSHYNLTVFIKVLNQNFDMKLGLQPNRLVWGCKIAAATVIAGFLAYAAKELRA